jgi:hypothetical protein
MRLIVLSVLLFIVVGCSNSPVSISPESVVPSKSELEIFREEVIWSIEGYIRDTVLASRITLVILDDSTFTMTRINVLTDVQTDVEGVFVLSDPNIITLKVKRTHNYDYDVYNTGNSQYSCRRWYDGRHYVLGMTYLTGDNLFWFNTSTEISFTDKLLTPEH